MTGPNDLKGISVDAVVKVASRLEHAAVPHVADDEAAVGWEQGSLLAE